MSRAARDLGCSDIGKWYRFSDKGFERFGRLTEVEFRAPYKPDAPTRLSVSYKTSDELRGSIFDVDLDAVFTPVEAPGGKS